MQQRGSGGGVWRSGSGGMGGSVVEWDYGVEGVSVEWRRMEGGVEENEGWSE